MSLRPTIFYGVAGHISTRREPHDYDTPDLVENIRKLPALVSALDGDTAQAGFIDECVEEIGRPIREYQRRQMQ